MICTMTNITLEWDQVSGTPYILQVIIGRKTTADRAGEEGIFLDSID